MTKRRSRKRRQGDNFGLAILGALVVGVYLLAQLVESVERNPVLLVLVAGAAIAVVVAGAWWFQRRRLNAGRFPGGLTLVALEQMTALQFEKVVADFFRMGGCNASLTQTTGDHGVDVQVITPLGERWLVQCKHHAKPVGEPTLRDLYGTVAKEGAHWGILMATNGVTPKAQQWATGVRLRIVNGPELVSAYNTLLSRASGMDRPAKEHFVRQVLRL